MKIVQKFFETHVFTKKNKKKKPEDSKKISSFFGSFLEGIPEWVEKKKLYTDEEILDMSLSCFNLSSANLVQLQQVIHIHRMLFTKK